MTSVARPLRPAPEARPTYTPTRLRVVEPQDRRSRRRPIRPGMVLAVGVVVVFAALMASAGIRSMLVTGQEDLDVTRAQIRNEQRLLQSEKVTLAVAQSPTRIAAEAEALGMVATDDQRWVSLGPSTAPTTEPPVDEADTTNELAAAPQ